MGQFKNQDITIRFQRIRNQIVIIQSALNELAVQLAELTEEVTSLISELNKTKEENRQAKLVLEKIKVDDKNK